MRACTRNQNGAEDNGYQYEVSSPLINGDPEGSDAAYMPDMGTFNGFLNRPAGSAKVGAVIDFVPDVGAFNEVYGSTCFEPVGFFQIVRWAYDATFPQKHYAGGTPWSDYVGLWGGQDVWHSDGWQHGKDGNAMKGEMSSMNDNPGQNKWATGQTFFRMQFETAAVNKITGDVYGSVVWGFLVTPTAGNLMMEHINSLGANFVNLPVEASDPGNAPSDAMMDALVWESLSNYTD